MARLTESQLKRMIQQEYALAKKQEMLNEARVNLIVEQMMEEGWLSNISAGFKGAVKGAAKGVETAAGKATDKAGAVKDAFVDKAKAMYEPMKAMANNAKQAYNDIKSDVVKAAATEAAKSLNASLEKEVKSIAASAYKKLMASGVDAETAKEQLKSVVTTAVGIAVDNVLNKQQ